MRAVSALGTAYGLMALVSVVMFTRDLRKGFVLGQLVITAGLSAQLLKLLFALPRPHHVDGTVALLDGPPQDTPFIHGDAVDFWGLPSAEVIQWVRSLDEVSFGFPSGHTAVSLAFFGGLALLTRSRWTPLLAGVMVCAMMASRVFLGKHFPADLCGGLLVGGLPLLVVWAIFVRGHARGGPISLKAYPLGLYLGGISLFFAGFVMQLKPGELGSVLGFNLAFWLLYRRGLPREDQTQSKRVARWLLAPLIFFVLKVGFDGLEGLLGQSHFLRLLEAVVCNTGMVMGAVLLGERWGLYLPQTR